MTAYERGVEDAKCPGSWIFDCPFSASEQRAEYNEWVRGFREERDRQEVKTFEDADKMVHPVEQQWHYPILTKHGFVPETKEAVGFVRAYIYKHPDGRVIKCNTGCSSDYWTDMGTKATGYWSSLEAHVTR